jgi:hypothetical protein
MGDVADIIEVCYLRRVRMDEVDAVTDMAHERLEVCPSKRRRVGCGS